MKKINIKKPEFKKCSSGSCSFKDTVKKKLDYKTALLKKFFAFLKPKKSDNTNKILIKIILWPLAVLLGFFIITFVIYFFNLDMKAMALVEPLFQKHYDKMPRNQYI